MPVYYHLLVHLQVIILSGENRNRRNPLWRLSKREARLGRYWQAYGFGMYQKNDYIMTFPVPDRKIDTFIPLVSQPSIQKWKVSIIPITDTLIPDALSREIVWWSEKNGANQGQKAETTSMVSRVLKFFKELAVSVPRNSKTSLSSLLERNGNPI